MHIIHLFICIYLVSRWPLFLKVDPTKQGLFQLKQWSSKGSRYIYLNIIPPFTQPSVQYAGMAKRSIKEAGRSGVAGYLIWEGDGRMVSHQIRVGSWQIPIEIRDRLKVIPKLFEGTTVDSQSSERWNDNANHETWEISFISNWVNDQLQWGEVGPWYDATSVGAVLLEVCWCIMSWSGWWFCSAPIFLGKFTTCEKNVWSNVGAIRILLVFPMQYGRQVTML